MPPAALQGVARSGVNALVVEVQAAGEGPEMAIIAILECHFKPEQVEAGIDWLRRNLVATRAFGGCLGVEVFEDGDDPSRVVAVEHWASLEHDRAYRAWRDGEGRIVEGGDLFVGPPRLTVGVVRDDV